MSPLTRFFRDGALRGGWFVPASPCPRGPFPEPSFAIRQDVRCGFLRAAPERLQRAAWQFPESGLAGISADINNAIGGDFENIFALDDEGDEKTLRWGNWAVGRHEYFL
jgi:hypothetical protein